MSACQEGAVCASMMTLTLTPALLDRVATHRRLKECTDTAGEGAG